MRSGGIPMLGFSSGSLHAVGINNGSPGLDATET